MSQAIDLDDLVRVCDEQRLPIGRSLSVPVDGDHVAVFATSSGYFAVSNACPHEGAPLAGCPVVGEAVICARHGWRIPLASRPNERSPDGLRRYEVAVLDGVIYVKRPQAEQ